MSWPEWVKQFDAIATSECWGCNFRKDHQRQCYQDYHDGLSPRESYMEIVRGAGIQVFIDVDTPELKNPK